MQSEEFDKKVREAADHHHPLYDEGAWSGMEKMLDKHLPQKKDDRRKFVLFLLFFLIAGGGAAFMLFNRLGEHKIVSANEQAQTEKNISTDNTVAIRSDNNMKKDNVSPEPENGSGIPSDQKGLSGSTSYNISSTLPDKNVRRNILTNTAKSENRTNSLFNKEAAQNIEYPAPDKKDVERSTDEKTIASVIPKVPDNTPVQRIDDSEKDVNAKDTHTEIAAEPLKEENNSDKEESVITKQINQNKKSNNKKSSFFFASLSVAPDVSAAGSDKAGKLKLSTGVGVGYTLHGKFSLRTGFYTSRKIYSASPGEYHPPASFWNYYPNLESVDADCKVYEIPLLLSYHFGSSLKQNWFGTAGLSSYLMKRETYQYTWKDFTGQYRNTSRSIYDVNKHYFSVLTISAGYQRQINNTFFFTAEPYVKIPLTGVGYGKVKLNSLGALFSVGITPFNVHRGIKKVAVTGK